MTFNTQLSPLEISLPLNLKDNPHFLEPSLLILIFISCFYFWYSPLLLQPNNINIFLPYCSFVLSLLSITMTKPKLKRTPQTYSSKTSHVRNTYNKIHYMSLYEISKFLHKLQHKINLPYML